MDGFIKEIKELTAPNGKTTSVAISDRNFNSKQLRKVFNQMFSDGIAQNIKNCFKVSPGTGMNVIIQPGAGMMGGAIGIEDKARTIQVQASNPTLDRVDSVVLRLDDNPNYRTIDLYIVQGDASDLPKAKPPVRNDTVYEIVLAHIFIARGTNSIPEYRITDTRLNSSICGIMQPRPGADTTGLFTQYQDALNEFLDTVDQALDGSLAGQLKVQINKVSQKVDAFIEEFSQKITFGTEPPTGGKDGDIYIQIEV